MQKTNTQKLRGKDFMTIGIFSVLIMIISLVASALFIPFLSVTFPFVAGAMALFASPVYLLMSYKVAKRGTMILFTTVLGLIFAILGTVHMLPYAIITGIICEAVMWKRGSYRNFWHNTAGYTVFSVLFYVSSSYVPVYIFGSEYYVEHMVSNNAEAANIQAQFAFQPIWVAVAVVTAVAAALIGCLIGRRLLKKHFIKAGLITDEGRIGGVNVEEQVGNQKENGDRAAFGDRR